MNTNDPQSSKEPKDLPQNSKEGNKNQAKENNKKGDDFFAYAKSNKEQTIAYILLVLGLLFLLFYNNLLGGLLIGLVAGYYFSSEIIYYLRNIGQVVGGQDQLRYVILTALLLGLFIAAPGIFIGALVVAVFKNTFCSSCKTSKPNGSDKTSKTNGSDQPPKP